MSHAISSVLCLFMVLIAAIKPKPIYRRDWDRHRVLLKCFIYTSYTLTPSHHRPRKIKEIAKLYRHTKVKHMLATQFLHIFRYTNFPLICRSNMLRWITSKKLTIRAYIPITSWIQVNRNGVITNEEWKFYNCSILNLTQVIGRRV